MPWTGPRAAHDPGQQCRRRPRRLDFAHEDEDWEQTLQINLSAVFRLSKACLRRMLKERHGRIINIGSVVGSIGNAGQVHYAAAKAGLVGFTKALAKEVATRNITVNTVAPGFIETDMTRALPAAQREAYLAQIPVGRFGAAEEVANAVLFLASREAGLHHRPDAARQWWHVHGLKGALKAGSRRK
jgi:3-oxoacyl-[acyl-carrier protein] reductase